MSSIETQLRKSAWEYAHFDERGVTTYPASPELTGHLPSIAHPGLFYVEDFPPTLTLLDSLHSSDALALSSVEQSDVLIGKLVPREKIDLAIISTANALQKEVTDPDETVFVPILTGGLWYYDELRSLLPDLLTDDRFDSVRIERTHGSKLGEITIAEDFDPEKIAGKVVWLIEDLGDENKTLRATIDRALELGAKEVKVAMLTNKIGVPQKHIIPELHIVGLGIPGSHWMGGAGADFRDEIGRDQKEIWVKKTRTEWQALGLL